MLIDFYVNEDNICKRTNRAAYLTSPWHNALPSFSTTFFSFHKTTLVKCSSSPCSPAVLSVQTHLSLILPSLYSLTEQHLSQTTYFNHCVDLNTVAGGHAVMKPSALPLKNTLIYQYLWCLLFTSARSYNIGYGVFLRGEKNTLGMGS